MWYHIILHYYVTTAPAQDLLLLLLLLLALLSLLLLLSYIIIINTYSLFTLYLYSIYNINNIIIVYNGSRPGPRAPSAWTSAASWRPASAGIYIYIYIYIYIFTYIYIYIYIYIYAHAHTTYACLLAVDAARAAVLQTSFFFVSLLFSLLY